MRKLLFTFLIALGLSSSIALAQAPAVAPTAEATAAAPAEPKMDVVPVEVPTDPNSTIVLKDAAPPKWLEEIIGFMSQVPYVGPVIVFIGKWAGFLAAMLTSLALFLHATSLTLYKTFSMLGAQRFAEAVKKYAEKILPWVKYFSMFNVQKKS